MIASLKGFLRKASFYLIVCIVYSLLSARAQAQVESMARRLAILINTDKIAEMERLIDSVRFNTDTASIHNLTLFQYAMYTGNDRAFDALFRRIKPTTDDDLYYAAQSGNTRYFLEVLHNRNSRDLEDYESASFVLNPLSAESKKQMVELLLKEFELSEEDLEVKPEFTDPDTLAIKGWIDHIRNISSAKEAEDYFAEIALDEEVNSPGKGSTYLMNCYVRNASGKLMGYRSDYFTKVFHEGRWDMVDFFISRGVKYNLLDVNISFLEDPDQALGYFVQEQLVDQAAKLSDLASARAWKAPKATFTIFKGKESNYTEAVDMDDDRLNYCVWLTGSAAQFNATVKGATRPSATGCLLKFVLNLREREKWTNDCSDGYRIIIPASDLSKPWEYHGVTINNDGQSGNGFINATVPITVHQGGVIIDTVWVGSKVQVNRAFGPVEIKAPFKSLESYGVIVYLNQKKHKERLGFDIHSRLYHYQMLINCLEKQQTISSGSAKSFDARTSAKLTSAQLIEAKIPQAVAGELRVAMRSLAEQSEFSARFSNFVYREMLGGDITQTIDPFLSSGDEVIRGQALELVKALDRRTAALNLLQAENIAAYAAKIRGVKALVLELAQYYQKEDLGGAIADVLHNLSPQLQDAFKRNVNSSLNLLALDASMLSGKGQVILKSFTAL